LISARKIPQRDAKASGEDFDEVENKKTPKLEVKSIKNQRKQCINRLNLVLYTLPALRPACGIYTAAQNAPSQEHKRHGVQTVQSKTDTL
jgi:hypothetical protein